MKKMGRERRYINVQLKGDFYILSTYCHTLKEFLESNKIKRSAVKAWYYRND